MEAPDLRKKNKQPFVYDMYGYDPQHRARMAVKPCYCLWKLILEFSNQNNHFKSTFRIFRIPGISNKHVHSPLFLTSITSICKRIQDFSWAMGATPLILAVQAAGSCFLWASLVELMVGGGGWNPHGTFSLNPQRHVFQATWNSRTLETRSRKLQRFRSRGGAEAAIFFSGSDEDPVVGCARVKIVFFFGWGMVTGHLQQSL